MDKFHRDNLTKLANYLDSMSPKYAAQHFNMLGYIADYDEDGDIDREYDPEDVSVVSLNMCGTAACAIGHGPAAGLEVKYTDYNWYRYMERTVGIIDGSDAWYYMFGPHHSNDPKEAAQRIRDYLDNPENYNA